jgi:transposase
MQTGNKVTIGMDVSDRWSQIAVMDDTGAVVLRERVQTTRAHVRKYFDKFAGTRIAIEVGPHSPWLSRALAAAGLEVIVGNPRKIGLIHSNDRKSDQVDAETLARLARVDPKLLFPIKHRREDTQSVLAFLRSRDVLVRSRTQLINSVRGQVKAIGGRMPSCSTENFHQKADAIPELLEDALTPLMEIVGALTEKIRHQTRVIEELCQEVYPETEMFTDVDGVGPITALTYLLTIEEPGRFRSSREVGAYLGLRPRRDQSGDTDKELPVTKAGDSRLRRLLVQCAHRILGPFGKDSDLRRWGLKLAERGGRGAKRRAVVAVARKLAVLLHRLWVTGEVYEPLRNTNLTEQAA